VGLGLLLASGALGCAQLGLGRKTVAPPPAQVVAAPYLLLRLSERRVYLMDDPAGTTPRSFPVAIGRKPWETPTGRFHIQEMVKDPDWVQFDWNNPSRVIRRIPPGPNNPMGRRWIGFARAHGWEVGFHGTPKPEVLGQAVSHGCVRMHNDDVVKIFDRVKIGTPVIVEP
jgi:lipoprotein-anchoring transpeptidase ErfK/SrfK